MTPDFARYLESLLAELAWLDPMEAFNAWRIRREVAINVAEDAMPRASAGLVGEFRVPATPHSDHAHRLLLDAGARVCPCCGLYIFLADPRAKFLIGQHDSWRNGDSFFIGEPPPCPLCEVKP